MRGDASDLIPAQHDHCATYGTQELYHNDKLLIDPMSIADYPSLVSSSSTCIQVVYSGGDDDASGK